MIYKNIALGMLGIAGALFAFALGYEVVQIYKDKKEKNREEDNDPDIAEEIAELECKLDEEIEENTVCSECDKAGECHPLDMADALERGCEKRTVNGKEKK